jgi:toxin ParE1/3/4
MGLTVRFRQQALADLENIAGYIAEYDPAAADRVMQRIHRSIFTTLLTVPKAGRVNEDLQAREFPVPNLPYLIVYVLADVHLEIIGVFHTARDPATKPRL